MVSNESLNTLSFLEIWVKRVITDSIYGIYNEKNQFKHFPPISILKKDVNIHEHAVEFIDYLLAPPVAPPSAVDCFISCFCLIISASLESKMEKS